jgi:uncharacterized protein YndB with AHSA1/START domain
MTETKATAPTTLCLRRTFAASRDRVFAAWTTPAIAREFMGPGDVRADKIEMDVRVGGSYSITMLKPDGERLIASGIYREVRPPERIVCTWSWEEDDPALARETLLTLEFIERGEATEVVLTHENFRDEQQRDNHREGWTPILEQLAGALGIDSKG